MTLSAAVRLAYGAMLVVAPGIVLGTAGRAGDDRRFRVVVRVLGARHVTQALIVSRWPTAAVRRGGAIVDGLHAVTDIGCAFADPRHRLPATADAAVAVALASASARR